MEKGLFCGFFLGFFFRFRLEVVAEDGRLVHVFEDFREYEHVVPAARLLVACFLVAVCMTELVADVVAAEECHAAEDGSDAE